MGVREIDRSLEQWQMGVKDLRRRVILAPTPRERERWYAILLLAQGLTTAATADALERDPHRPRRAGVRTDRRDPGQPGARCGPRAWATGSPDTADASGWPGGWCRRRHPTQRCNARAGGRTAIWWPATPGARRPGRRSSGSAEERQNQDFPHRRTREPPMQEPLMIQ